MKKIVLSLAGVMAAVAFAPEASAVPAFARQTGMACTACHFQHFPLLNGFGRAFKAAGYTMMGAQEKVEGEHLSIPATLNMTVLATAGVETSSNNKSNLFVPGAGGELQLFFGGKVNDFSGFLSEFGTSPAGAASAKLHLMPEIASGVHAGVSIYSSGQGAGSMMEMLNTGATSIHRLMGNIGPAGQHIRAYSARQYLAGRSQAGASLENGTGASINAVGDNFVVAFARELNANPAAGAVAGGAAGSAGGLPYQYIRGIFMTDIAGWDSGFGIQNFSGAATPAAGGLQQARKATIVDAQMQGKFGEMPVGFYASYGTAAASNAAETNLYNAGTASANSFNIAGEFGVVPGVATVQVALRNAKTGAGLSDNAVMIGGSYELSMNMELSLHYTTQSGNNWNAVGGVVPAGKNATTLLLETLF